MNDLPNEMLFQIIPYLGLKSLLKLRLVSKRFKACVDILIGKLNELIIKRPGMQKLTNWYHTNDLIEQDNIVNLGLKSIRLNIPLDLSRLKRLFLNCIVGNNDLKYLNTLHCLEQLEFSEIFCQFDDQLVLPSLKILFIHEINGSILYLDTPVLDAFGVIWLQNRIVFKNSKTIKHLFMGTLINDLNAFVNLEILKTDRPKLIDDFNVLDNFPKLRELRIDKDFDEKFQFNYERTKLTIDHLIIMKIYKKRAFKIYFDNQLIDNYFDTYQFYKNKSKIFKNFSLLQYIESVLN